MILPIEQTRKWPCWGHDTDQYFPPNELSVLDKVSRDLVGPFLRSRRELEPKVWVVGNKLFTAEHIREERCLWLRLNMHSLSMLDDSQDLSMNTNDTSRQKPVESNNDYVTNSDSLLSLQVLHVIMFTILLACACFAFREIRRDLARIGASRTLSTMSDDLASQETAGCNHLCNVFCEFEKTPDIFEEVVSWGSQIDGIAEELAKVNEEKVSKSDIASVLLQIKDEPKQYLLYGDNYLRNPEYDKWVNKRADVYGQIYELVKPSKQISMHQRDN